MGQIRGARVARGLAILSLALAVPPLLVACASSVEEKHSAAFNLYVIDNDSIPADDTAPVLQPYKRQLLMLRKGCTGSEDDLADSAVAVKERVLEDTGADVPTLRIMQLMNLGLGTVKRDCTEAFALVGLLLAAPEPRFVPLSPFYFWKIEG
ncbi:MAG: hypothetical protein ABR521_09240 [Gaiellaceae bacterium]